MERRKLAIVTGGSRGIGRAICRKLAAAGCDIIFNYRNGEEDAKETQRLCEQEGAAVTAVQADISKPEDCAKLTQKAAEIGNGQIDILVNNAGITRDNLILRMTDQEFDEVQAINLRGSFCMMRNVSKYMLRKKAGRIVNISSVVGVRGNAGQVNYAASKAGIIGMTKSLAKELASRKITVNAVAPGMIATDMTSNLKAEIQEKMAETIPMREIGKPEDIANAVAFLCGDESSYITGQVLCVDGGMAI